ncbi:hypothetical protein EXIGLDRAFT_608480 [Exidia glandulosa HHB12029]|uniref:Endonuclease/exonuclease/phosphatase domain-containing protein n=1 Tax=Exidia glandulosa HHB12029 TaxID=1314781 RepID=A0A165KWW3_EXIGL|nr:hypothetical protein EXIGLDRAFT_608480 [Exidia glandulosa HHB12029]
MNFSIPKKDPATTRIAAWNVAGMKACLGKGFKIYTPKEDADIWVLTETKMNAPSLEPALTKNYPYRYWSISTKPGYAGTCILSKIKPLNVSRSLPSQLHSDPDSTKGRIITLEFDNYYLVGTYVVNAGEKLKSMEAKKEWMKAFHLYLAELDAKKPVVWAGDVNCAPTAKDLAKANDKWNKRPGYTEVECTAFKKLLDEVRLVDVWRDMNPTLEHYTFWDYRTFGRTKGDGWRLDMFVLSERIRDWVKSCEIRDEIYGASDHCPIVMDICIPVPVSIA